MDRKRSFTDPITGRVHLRNLPLPDRLPHLYSNCLPLSDLPELLHERAHHSMATSQVGIALAALAARIARRRLAGGEEAADCERLALATTYLQPLAEGLALFAEHDLYPGDSQVCSDVMALVFPLFCAGTLARAPNAAEVERCKRSALSRTRGQRFAVDAKADLLESPLDGPYLSGYWCIKRMHKEARRRSEKMYDSDFFFAFALLWLFDGAELASALVAPPPSRGGPSLEEVSLIFQLRLREMFDEGFAARVDEAEQFLATGPMPDEGDVRYAPLDWPKLCGWTPELHKTFGRALGEVADVPGGAIFKMWDHRSIFRLGHYDVEVDIDSTGRFSAAPVKGEALPGVASGRGPGRVEAWVGKKGLRCILTVRRREQLVAVIDVFKKTLNNENALAFALRVPSSVELETLHLSFAMLSDPGAHDVVEMARATARQIFAAPGHGGGILAALGGSRTLLRTLAAVSLQNSLTRFEVTTLAQRLEIDAAELADRLAAINDHSMNALRLALVEGLPALAVCAI